MGIEERELNEFNRADIIAGKIQQIRANIKALEEEYPRQRTRGEAYQKRRNQYLRMMKQYTNEFVKLISLRDLYKVIISRTTAESRVMYIYHLKESEIRYLLNRLGILSYRIVKIETSETLDLQMIL
jgi:hypothetical protein|uniref:Uncharacterized protein n=1 Tax=Ackermannviridae sp. ctUml7 TaxID=2825753 RepID=A0A8S5V9N3_9CAUD|nr:MAG TPA: hypothetical protein [Ackermannviridae sp. ctUml7]